MKHYGDITKINGAEVPIVDVICGGSPCQDLSVAGRREGLAGERSGLFMEQIRIIREQRNECIRQLQMRGAAFDIRRVRPRFMVWENVPGAFSSNKGEDFRVVLEETARVVDKDAVIPGLEKGQKWSPAGCVLGDGWSIAWRLHDAQFWGVPQRRKRIALVADFAGESAPEILFERKSVSRDIEQSGETRETVTRSPEGDVNPSSYTLKIRGGREVDSHGKKAGKGALIQTEISGTLGVSQDQTLFCSVCIGNGQVHDAISPSVEVSKTLNCMVDPMKVVTYGLDRASFNQGQNAKYNFAIEEEKSPTIVAKGPGGVSSRTTDNRAVVRRLTPLECERLQGFPTIREVRCTEMTKDEYIAWNINEGNILVDTKNGKVFRTRGQRGTKLDTPKEMPGTNVNGYLCVSIRNGETKMSCRVHRIVWIAAHGIIPDGYVIDHINNNKQDNRIDNLQMLTPEENSHKAKSDGLYRSKEDSPTAKISDEVHDLIQYIYDNSEISIRQLSEIFGISKSRVHQIIHDRGWTDIGDWVDTKGKKHKGDADSPRYKALGNSIALPFWEWMAQRMVQYLGDEPTMASLFDGIGGFPLVFNRAGCKPVWASEIEEFPIAVTKIRFPEE